MELTNKKDGNPLSTPVQFVKGVGPQRAELLAKLGLHLARDILFFFPRDYQDMSEVRSVRNLEEGPVVSICGTVEEIELRDSGGGRSILGVLIRQEHDYLRAVWFNQPFMQQRFQQGQQVLLSGTAKLRGFRWEMQHPQVQMLSPDDDEPRGGIQPIYRLTEGIKQHQMRRIVHGMVDTYVEHVPEVFPAEFLDTHCIWPIHAALPQIHKPTSRESLQQARYRFVYQELLVMQLALGFRRSSITAGGHAPTLPVDARIDARIRRLLPFRLTDGQQTVIDDISRDIARETPMNRLLQGDVGSGKTVVAAYAMLVAVANKHQAVLMAPTELLALQHLSTLQNLLRESKVRIVALTGSLTHKQRAECLQEIAAGEIDLVVGTQAVVQQDVKFSRLGLAIVDEQHKFGVRQRALLRQSETEPHYLVMTATPIPRTVAMTVFGDLDVSILRDLPPGRQAAHTYLGVESKRAKWWEFVRKKLREGRQAYVIAPLVDDEREDAPTGAEQAFESLVSGELDAFRVDVLHGRMSADEKQAAMNRFRSGQTQVLVATSLVEVGVDVPNATVMTIENGERFGLAQLHQLRGRVGRGNHAGFVCVFSASQSPESQQRLDAFASTTDGFELAEIDFRLRGPGDLFSTKQHGLPPLRVADLIGDAEIAEKARRDARGLLASDPELRDAKYALLRTRVISRYGRALALGDVG